MAKDISNKTVALLLVLVIIVSLVGTWIVSNKVTEVKEVVSQSMDTSKGQLSFGIGEPEEENDSEPDTETGTLSFGIIE